MEMMQTTQYDRIALVALERLAHRGVVVFTGRQYVLAEEGHSAAYVIQTAWRNLKL